MPRVLFVAGDPSGDLHSAHVARHLKAQNPSLEIWALGGPSLQKTADRFLANLVDKSVVGFWEPFKKLPEFWHLLNRVLRPALQDHKPDVVVPVDFFGFNQFTARAAKAEGCRVAYFISPQVWASRPGRIQTLKKVVDRMLVIFPFEAALYKSQDVPATFVGHPLLDVLPETPEAEPPLKVEPVIGLLPGSRAGEVRRHLPLFLQCADILSRKRAGMRFILFAAPSLSNDFYDRLLGPNVRRPYLLEIVRDEAYEWRSGIDLALTCSGTATLENALMGIPMLAVYRMSWVTYSLAKTLIRVPYIAMPNILAEKALVPEFIQSRAAPENLAAAAWDLLQDPARRKSLRRELLGLRAKLGGPGAARRAAEEILSELSRNC
jgi:lipid-A-disaccharide synthase